MSCCRNVKSQNLFEHRTNMHDSKCTDFFSEITPLKHNAVISGCAGLIFFMAWWILIDVNIQFGSIMEHSKMYLVPGVIATFALVGVNVMPSELLYATYSYHTTNGCCTPFMAKLALLAFLMASFGCLIAASYILINDFILDQTKHQWLGWGIFLQNLFIFVSCVLLRFGKRKDLF